MLGLPMVGQGPCRQVRVAPGAADALMEQLPVDVSLLHHTEAVGLCRVPPLAHGKYDKPCSPSWPHWCGGPHG